MAKHLETGKKAEILASIFLEEKGYEIIARNYRSGRAEIDLIAKKGIFVVFVEVKSLTNTKFGNPEISVTKNKKAVNRFVCFMLGKLYFMCRLVVEISYTIIRRKIYICMYLL